MPRRKTAGRKPLKRPIIVKELLKDAERTDAEIARKTESSRTAVYKERRRLEKEKQINVVGRKGRKQELQQGRKPVKKPKIIAELLKNADRTNPEIAKITGSNKVHVHKERHRLEKQGKIKRFRGGGLSYSTRRKIVKELHENPYRFNTTIAEIAGADPVTIRKIRNRLEGKGRIQEFDGRRKKQTLYSKAKTIIKELLENPKKTNKEIAEIAGTSANTVGRIRKKLKEKGKIKGFESRTKREASKKIPFSTAKTIIKELRKNPERSNEHIARKLKVSHALVRKIRLWLEGKGRIERYRYGKKIR